jgi:phosphomannomutase
VNESLVAEVRAWIAGDPDDADRRDLEGLLERGDEEELRRRFGAPLRFGTAGLRGPEMAGPSGMNRYTVRRATQGVVAWLEELGADLSRGVVVGRDARHGSESFNDEAVAVLLGSGVRVIEMPEPLPTPFVPYVVRAMNLVAGIMITASHNPPQDNGYKLYDASGSQIITPSDAIVERYASEAGAATLADRESELHSYVSDEVLSAYGNHFVSRFGVGASDVKITYTPLHGVGGKVMTSLFKRAGYRHVSVVDAQFRPDGSFPTLPFPNPEELGALDLATATADENGARLVIANDPDADRLGVAVKQGDHWRVLRGDEIGWLLASSLLHGCGPDDVVATTIVSSAMLGKMAHASHVPFVETLTGFKWIARADSHRNLRFGYEEALGYAVDSLVGDKDGLSAALALCALTHQLDQRGLTLIDQLDELEATYGVHAGAQLSLRASGADGEQRMHAALTKLRENPPAVVAGLNVTSFIDLAEGYGGLPPTEGLRFELARSGRVVVRPSGTEAKLKVYIEVTPGSDGDIDLRLQRSRAATIVERIKEEFTSLLAL